MSLSTKAYKVTIRHPMWPGRSETFHFDDLDASQRFMKFWIAVKGDADFEHVLHHPGYSAANDGGPVFPGRANSSFPEPLYATGMTLREYFAAHAPQPNERMLWGGVDEEQRDAILRACAENAYRWADAMIRARER